MGNKKGLKYALIGLVSLVVILGLYTTSFVATDTQQNQEIKGLIDNLISTGVLTQVQAEKVEISLTNSKNNLKLPEIGLGELVSSGVITSAQKESILKAIPPLDEYLKMANMAAVPFEQQSHPDNLRPSVTPRPSIFKFVIDLKSNTFSINLSDEKNSINTLVYKDRTLIPLRLLSEYFDAKVVWKSDTKQALITLGNKNIAFTQDTNKYIIDNSEFTMDTEVINVNGKLMVPVRVLGDKILGCNVSYADGIVTLERSQAVSEVGVEGGYKIVDSDQKDCFSAAGEKIDPPKKGDPVYGQDAQFQGLKPSYKDNNDGTVTDNVTGLMWVKDDGEKVDQEAYDAGVKTCNVGGYTDWRIPTVKELYSLFNGNGTDPNVASISSLDVVPFIDIKYFNFAYGSGAPQFGNRIIDSQYWSGTKYIGNTSMTFGVNFADGRIKGYEAGLSKYAKYVRGNINYGKNLFVNNNNKTITDKATGLMWMQLDSGRYNDLVSDTQKKDGSLDWAEALKFAQTANANKLLGYSDWRLPNTKELQSLVNYQSAPEYNGKPAIDTAYFECTQIIDEAKSSDYPFYWTSTTHIEINSQNVTNGTRAMYVAFGKALGYMNNAWINIHGAGCQRSDDKISTTDSSVTKGPQGDVGRSYNYVRLVRDAG